MNGDVETYHEAGQWKNKVEGNSQASSVHETKDDALAAGRRMAQDHGGEHIIKNMDGTIGEKQSHGNDPYPPKG